MEKPSVGKLQTDRHSLVCAINKTPFVRLVTQTYVAKADAEIHADNEKSLAGVQSLAVNADALLTGMTGDMFTSLTQVVGVSRWLTRCMPHSS